MPSRLVRLVTILLLAVAATLHAPRGAEAQSGSLVWEIRSLYRYQVEIAFFAQNRDWQWPGNGNVWVLDDDNYRTFTLNCRNGERICYGAWVRGDASRYWGVGYGNRQRCDACCYTCGAGGTQPITLR